MSRLTPTAFTAALLVLVADFGHAAPTICRTCNNCSSHLDNSTSSHDAIAVLLSLETEMQNATLLHRLKRSAEVLTVSRKPCEVFRPELFLIPVCVALIPITLIALVMCSCCCGPKDSRVKLPDNFLHIITGTSGAQRKLPSEELELEYKDGYVQRKDSSRTKFSTVVSIIEQRRSSIWSIRTNASTDSAAAKPEDLADDRLRKSSSSGSIVRFNEQVSVLGPESLDQPKR